jgi:transposase
LKRCRYFLLKNSEDIDYTPKWRKGKKGYYWTNPRKTEKDFMELDENFYELRELKEKYIRFTHDHMNDPKGAEEELDQLIKLYKNSRFSEFRYFACTLENNKDGIIASFTFLDAERSRECDQVLHRLSNGVMESFNNLPKDYKRSSNGVSNFDYTRNRLLWATRKNPSMRAVPRSKEEIHTKGKLRGPYNKPRNDKGDVE